MAKSSRKALLLSAALERFMLGMQTSGKSQNTIRGYRQRLTMLLKLLETSCTEDGQPVRITELKRVTTDICSKLFISFKLRIWVILLVRSISLVVLLIVR
jgi:hypothetical protein